jgi:hypothetical protein
MTPGPTQSDNSGPPIKCPPPDAHESQAAIRYPGAHRRRNSRRPQKRPKSRFRLESVNEDDFRTLTIFLAEEGITIGHHHLAVADELRRILAELDQTGREIFCTHIAALGLHSTEIVRLHFGSADYSKSPDLAPAIEGFVRSAGLYENRRPIWFSDESI